MADIIVEDLVNGQVLNETADNVSLTRLFKVRLPAASGVAGIIQVRNANGIPAIGDIHPTAPSLTVETLNVTPTAGDNTIFTVTCTYSQPNAEQRKADDDAPAQISIGTTTTSYQTDIDRDGNQMVFTPSSGGGPDPVKALPPQTFIADVPRVLGVFTMTRKETKQPGIKALEYGNKVNSETFLGLPAGQVYCDSIRGDSSDGGETYVVTYSFTADPKGWSVRGVYTIDNEPVNNPAPSESNGTEGTFDELEAIAFNALNLV